MRLQLNITFLSLSHLFNECYCFDLLRINFLSQQWSGNGYLYILFFSLYLLAGRQKTKGLFLPCPQQPGHRLQCHHSEFLAGSPLFSVGQQLLLPPASLDSADWKPSRSGRDWLVGGMFYIMTYCPCEPIAVLYWLPLAAQQRI